MILVPTQSGIWVSDTREVPDSQERTGGAMEIPGLTRLQSPTGENAPPGIDSHLEADVAQLEGQTPTAEISIARVADGASTAPKIDPGLQARIEAMRAQIRHKSMVSGGPTASDVNADPSVKVNYSILDQALASHGFEAMPDSDEEINIKVEGDSSDSDDTSSDSSSDSDDDDESDSPEGAPLTAEERERILIAADTDGPVSAEIPRTKNEVAEDEEPVRVPDFEIAANEPIEALGIISSIVGSACVVTGTPTPETRVLDVGSLLVFEDRSNLGFVADTFGPVILPMFTVRFHSPEQLGAAGVQPGRSVYSVPKHAVYVFSDTLRVKGTDASNIHDEEQSETEFSDDEQEAMYKAYKKQQRRADKQGSGGFSAPPRPPRPLNDLESIAMAQGLTYDPTQHQVRPQAGPTNFQRPQRGRGGAMRGSRGSRGHLGRPEINNFGRGPSQAAGAGTSIPGPETLQYDSRDRPPQSYQRAFYQADAAIASDTAAAPILPPSGQPSNGSIPNGAVTSSQPGTTTTPALYQPLKRPA